MITPQELTAEQIEKNWNRFVGLCGQLGERKEAALRLCDTLEQRLATAPASATVNYHNAFPGGLVDHSLRVLKNAIKLCKTFEWELPKESLIIGCLFHDLGKVGNHENDYYLDQDEIWKIEKYGQLYKYNNDMQYMDVPLRGIFLCQHFGLKLNEAELLAIYLNDGMYVDANKQYGLKEPMLAMVVHQADLISTKQEKGQLP